VGCVDWVRGCGGRRYTDTFSVSVWLLCVFNLSLLSLSARKSDFQAVLKEPTEGSETSAALKMTPGEIPKRRYTTFNTRRKPEIER
jgi:hypothetical protein